MCVWNIQRRERVHVLTGHTSTVSYIQTIRDQSHGMTIASGSYDHTIRLYDGETGAWLSSYDTSSMVNCFFMDSQRVIAPSRHGPYQLASLSVWDVRSNRPAVHMSNGESGEIFSMGVCGDVVVTGSTSAVQVITPNPFGTRRNDWNAVNVTLFECLHIPACRPGHYGPPLAKEERAQRKLRFTR